MKRFVLNVALFWHTVFKTIALGAAQKWTERGHGAMKKCIDCEYAKAYRKFTSTRYEFCCKHPDKEYIKDYFRKNRIRKMEGFLGYSKAGEFPIKTAPKWCPLKKMDGEDGNNDLHRQR